MKKISLRQLTLTVWFALLAFPGLSWSDSSSDVTGLPYVPGEILVKYKQDSINLETFTGQARSRMFLLSEGLDKKEDIPTANVSVITLDAGESVEEAVAGLKNNPRVEHVQPNYRYTSYVTGTDDTLGASLWALDNSNDHDIDAPEAWSISEWSDIIVAVIDTGVAYHHPDLAGNMWDGMDCIDEFWSVLGGCLHGYDFEKNDKNPLPDNEKHGTHVAGTIAALKNNGKGIVGVAPQAKIMALKTNLSTDEIIKSIAFAKSNGAQIINASWGGDYYDGLMYDSIADFPWLFVASAGNNAGDNDTDPRYPASFDLPNIIAVAATDQSDEFASFSNYGVSTVDIAAPGQGIISSVVDSIVLVHHDFNSVTIPTLPLGFLSSGTWGTFTTLWYTALRGDLSQFPYTSNNNSSVAFPSIDLSSYAGANLSFSIECDTEYITNGWADYIAVEASGDGVHFVPMADPFYDSPTWYIDEPYIDGFWDSDPTGSAQTSYSMSLPWDTLTTGFTLRYRWVANATDNNYAGCTIDDVVVDTFSDGSDEQYGSLSGTSMAAPHVSGVAALLLSKRPTLSTEQLKQFILEWGDTLPTLAGKTVSGKRLNAFGALNALDTSKTITDFIIPGSLSTSINDTDHSIIMYVPEAMYPLISPVISHTGLSISPSSGTQEDFSNPISYTVTADDGSTRIYTVTVHPVEDDKTDLTALITAEIGANHGNPVPARIQSDYTPATWSSYQAALQTAHIAESDILASPSSVANALATLQDALAGLVFVWKADLEAIIIRINALQEIDYNTTTWSSFIAAKNAALLQPESSNTQVVQKTDALASAIKLLRKDATLSSSTSVIALTEASRITVDAWVIAPQLDLSAFSSGGTYTLPGIDVMANVDNIGLSIADSTIVTSSGAPWDGVFDLPVLTAITLPSIANVTRSVDLAVELGDSTSHLTLSRAMRISLPGQAGKRIGYRSSWSTDFIEITSACASDIQTSTDLLAVGAECRIDVGPDLIIWTKHLTTFATYSQTTIASTGGGGGGGGGGWITFTSTKKTSSIKTATYTAATLLSRVDKTSNDPATRLMTVALSLDAGGVLLDTTYACQKKHTDTLTPNLPSYACQVAEKAQATNIISPTNTQFKPLQTVSRAEAYSIFMKSACVHPVTTGENWISEITKKAIELKFTVRTAENFEPNRPLSIFEMYAIAGQVKKYADTNNSCKK